MENFFSDTNHCKKNYQIIRDDQKPQVKDTKRYIENLWEYYSRYICPKRKNLTLNNAKEQLLQVFWEMYLFRAMRERGMDIEIGCSQGPDFFVQLGEKNFGLRL